MRVHYGIANLHIESPVVTMGSFDGVHKGHALVIDSLKRVARQLGGESVIISFEPHPREVLYPLEKRPGLLTTLDEKIEILRSYDVDHLLILPFTRELAALEYSGFVCKFLVYQIGIKGLVVGYDHRFGKNREGSFETLRQLSAEYNFYLEQEKVYEEEQINVSSTKIRTALELGDVKMVKEFLGYNYTLSGKVVHGEKIGRTIGFPTANLKISDSRKLLPAAGVYAVRVEVKGQKYDGMFNIGVRPTVSCSGIVNIEVNIFDFDEDIYDEKMRVSLIARIRGERKFDGCEELKEQLETDKKAALLLLED